VNIVVSSAEVKLGVDFFTAKLVEEVGDKWDRVPILSSDLVEVSEINRVAGCHPYSWQREQVCLLEIGMIR